MSFSITADQLNRLIADSERRKYNRLFVEGFKAEGDDFDVHPTFAHQHAEGEQSETHIRCAVTQSNEMLAHLDISLPAAELVLGWDSSKLCRQLIQRGATDVSDKAQREFHRSLRGQGVATEKLEAATISAIEMMLGRSDSK